jgi:hypothetical protein
MNLHREQNIFARPQAQLSGYRTNGDSTVTVQVAAEFLCRK